MNACLPGCVWNATPRSLSPLERNIDGEKIGNELELGVVKDDTKAGILAIIERMKEENEIDGVILGCTELPLAVNAEELSVLCFDTMKIHIAAIVDEICS